MHAIVVTWGWRRAAARQIHQLQRFIEREVPARARWSGDFSHWGLHPARTARLLACTSINGRPHLHLPARLPITQLDHSMCAA